MHHDGIESAVAAFWRQVHQMTGRGRSSYDVDISVLQDVPEIERLTRILKDAEEEMRMRMRQKARRMGVFI